MKITYLIKKKNQCDHGMSPDGNCTCCTKNKCFENPADKVLLSRLSVNSITLLIYLIGRMSLCTQADTDKNIDLRHYCRCLHYRRGYSKDMDPQTLRERRTQFDSNNKNNALKCSIYNPLLYCYFDEELLNTLLCCSSVL